LKRKASRHARRAASAVLAGHVLAAGPKLAAVPAPASAKGSNRSILLGFLILPVLMGLAALLPAKRLPESIGGTFKEHRLDLAICGAVGFGAVFFAWLISSALS
jgi:hypothetical protein